VAREKIKSMLNFRLTKETKKKLCSGRAQSCPVQTVMDLPYLYTQKSPAFFVHLVGWLFFCGCFVLVLFLARTTLS
jgi:hypothetical protein